MNNLGKGYAHLQEKSCLFHYHVVLLLVFFTMENHMILHVPSMFAVKAKIYGVIYNQSSLSLLMKHLVIGQHQKAPNFSACHWSPHGSLVSIGQHFVTTRVVHLPRRTETSLITEADLTTELDQAVRAVHSCNSWFCTYIRTERARK